MPWRMVTPVDERLRLIFEAQTGESCFAELCRRYGISRKTGYKWLHRFEKFGESGLRDLSREPHSQPFKVSERIEELLVQERVRHPTWGPKKLVALLQRLHGIMSPPAVSTAGAILKRHGLVRPRRLRQCGVRRWPCSLKEPKGPNDVWAADFKGWFRTRDGHRCDPLTVSDLYSRYLLKCDGLSRPTRNEVEPCFDSLFRDVGLPRAIRVDNGVPFGSRGAAGLSRLSVKWLRLGITVEYIEPGHPEQNGCHERMHRTLKAEATRPPKATLKEQQRRFDAWREEFNNLRPHESLGQTTPSETYEVPTRKFTGEIPDFTYPGNYETKRVKRNGYIKWRSRDVYIGEAFGESLVGFLYRPDEIMLVYAGNVLLGKMADSGQGGLKAPRPEDIA